MEFSLYGILSLLLTAGHVPHCRSKPFPRISGYLLPMILLCAAAFSGPRPADNLHDFIAVCRSRIEAGEADSLQTWADSLLTGLVPGEKDAALAGLFFESGHYRHSAYWFRRLYERHGDQETRRSLSAALRNAGVEAYGRRQFPEAADFLQESLALSPGPPELFHAAGAALFQAGRPEQSLACLEEGLRKYPDDRRMFQMLMSVSMQGRSPEELGSFLETLLEENPCHEEGRDTLSRLRAFMGKREESLRLLIRGMEKCGWNPRWAGTRAFLYHEYGQFALEREVYQDWLVRNPAADTLMIHIAKTHESQKQWPEARRVYRAFGDKRNALPYFAMAETFRLEGMPDSALFLYEAHLQGDPSDIASLMRAGEAAEALGLPDRALEFYGRWSSQHPDDPAPWMARGRVQEEKGQTQAAREAYLQAEIRGRKAASAYALYRLPDRVQAPDSRLLYRRLALERAVKEIEELESKTQDRLNPRRILLDSALDRGENARHDSLKNMIRHIYEEWITEDPSALERVLLERLQEHAGAPLLLDGLAGVYAATGRPEKARIFYEKAVERNPRDIGKLVKLGDLYTALGEADLALRVFRSAVEWSPHEEALMKRCIRAAEAAGRLESLARRWERLVETHAEYERMKENLIALWHRLGRNDKVTALKKENADTKKNP